jgi:hypothetical protein
MQTQNLKNHRRIVVGFHLVAALSIIVVLIGSGINLYRSWQHHRNLFAAALICAVTVILALLYGYIRSFPLKAQDRAIRAEENLRHFVLSGKLLDRRLRISQIIALRFASDEELVPLAARAAEEGLDNEAIKREIRNWRADHHRV